MTFDSLTNRGEFFSNHYLDAIIAGDLGDLRRQWDEADAAHKDTARSRLRSLSPPFFAARATASEAGEAARPDAVRTLNGYVLEALGFTVHRRTIELTHTTTDELHIPVAAIVETGSGLHLVALDADLADDVDDLFATGADADVRLLEPVAKIGEKLLIDSPAHAVGDLFATDDPPRWVMVVAGRIVLLAERARWAEGRFLAVDLDAALERNDTRKAGELETIAALFSTDVLVPDAGQAVIDELTDKSHKHAVGVSKELREGIRQSVEILANEVINRRLAANLAVYSGANSVDPRDLTRQCLRFLYRLLVLLYAESRPELGIVPINDEVYRAGYSLDRLRELTLVDLDTDEARNGSHLDQSLRALFELVNRGYHAEHAQTALRFDLDAAEPDESYEDYLQFPGLDAQLFDRTSTPLIDGVTLRNEALQQVLQLMMLSREGQGRNVSRGFISYAQLGINQLGAVYEGLMAYTGFFAKEDLYEVAKGGDPTDGTWVVPVDKADEYPDDVFVSRTEPLTGRRERIHHPKGSFVYRLSGRDRQRSASYYTPEVLTRCVVKHALAELLSLDDEPANRSSRITEARQILDLTICEPALGSGAFLNEAINQLSAEYLRRRQAELGETLDPERYNGELQKVKAHFALHQSYGVDLNATAVELAEVSLWLNCMHPGLKAPWFGLQLRRGNSLVGCRRATWRTRQLKNRPWAQTKKDLLQPPVDRPLAEPLEIDEIHHFLLPGHGWAAVADRKEAKDFRPDEAKALKAWRTKILQAPKASDADRLTALAAGVEQLWVAATRRIELTQQALRRPIDVWGAEPLADSDPVSRQKAMQALDNPDSSLGRLRTVMDAWVGLWFWELDAGVPPPTWKEWLRALDDLIGPDVIVGASGQLDLFDDLPTLLEVDERGDDGRPAVAAARAKYPWLAVAVDLARREGAWHWGLEFASAFVRGGFNLQVGNPPWTKLYRTDTGLAEDMDPHWGLDGPPAPNAIDHALRELLSSRGSQAAFLRETSVSEATRELLSNGLLRPSTHDLMINLYLLFIDTTWRHLGVDAVIGLVHPESHFSDPKARGFRNKVYGHLRRHFQFSNETGTFEDVHNMTAFGVHIYGRQRDPQFIQASYLFHPDTLDESLAHNGSGEVPGVQYRDGGWDLRPHAARIVTITRETLADWARLLDEPGTPATEATLLRPVTQIDLEALSVLADNPIRLADYSYCWSSGLHEKGAKIEGIIARTTRVPKSWHDVVIQGPHFTIATPFAKEPNEDCRSNRDYSEWDLEGLDESTIPRTNYQVLTDRDTYLANLGHWNGRPYVDYWRLVYRRMVGIGAERSVQPALVPPGLAHVHTVHSVAVQTPQLTALTAGLWSSLVVDAVQRVSGKADLLDQLARRLPGPMPDSPLTDPLLIRTLRLNCLTADYAPLWEELFRDSWKHDSWALSHGRVNLGDVQPRWDTTTPLRRDVDRRQALVELDTLAALMLGVSAEQLCALYKAQFAVLRKYEHSMVFDLEGRKICRYHHSTGSRQSRIQAQAKAGKLPKEWKNIWSLYEQWQEDPESVDWRGHFHPPFYRPDREAEMTMAYNEFKRRLDEGEYGT